MNCSLCGEPIEAEQPWLKLVLPGDEHAHLTCIQRLADGLTTTNEEETLMKNDNQDYGGVALAIIGVGFLLALALICFTLYSIASLFA